jgi:LPS sulfotransferase NodH
MAKPYFICATPRTGSNLVCEALAKTGMAGVPDEYFGSMHVPRWKERWQVESARDYVDRFVREAATDNGVWGVKVMMQYYDDVCEILSEYHGGREIRRRRTSAPCGMTSTRSSGFSRGSIATRPSGLPTLHTWASARTRSSTKTC